MGGDSGEAWSLAHSMTQFNAADLVLVAALSTEVHVSFHE